MTRPGSAATRLTQLNSWALGAGALLALAIATAAGCASDRDEQVSVGAPSSTTAATDPASRPPDAEPGPIGGGLQSGTGSDVELACPAGIEADSTEWFGPAGLTMDEAVREGFGDLVVGWIGEPELLGETAEWATWGLHLDDGALIAAVTVARTEAGWDPSHAKFCVIREPQPAPPPFTLYVSNQSFEDPVVEIEVTIDGRAVVGEAFDVGSQHSWKPFELELPAGEHRLRAVSGTGVEFEATLTKDPDAPLWVVLSYWWYPDEGARHFTFSTHDEPVAFG